MSSGAAIAVGADRVLKVTGMSEDLATSGYQADLFDKDHISGVHDSAIVTGQITMNSSKQFTVSGDVTIANTGAVTIAANAVEGSMLNTDVISGQTELASGIADTDELMISDAGTLKRVDASVFKTYIGASDDATALAIALG